GTHSHLAFGGGRAQAGGLGGHVEAADAASPAFSGAGKESVVVGPSTVGDPRRGVVEQVSTAFVYGACGQGRGVGGGGALRQTVRSEEVAAEHVRKQGRPLFFGAELGHRVDGQAVHAHAESDGEPPACQFLHDL